VDVADIEWIPSGHRFDVSDMTFFAASPERLLDDALADIDLIVTGPHASAAFPAEMRPFVDPSLTKRLQFDFTDVSTSPMARRWAAIDAHVLYIENPHPRAVRDANRARPDDLVAALREAFDRIVAGGEGARPSLGGVDAVRPVTFGYLPVLRRPQTDREWGELGAALTSAGQLGVDVYERVRDDLIDRVIEAKLRHLASLDPATTTSAAWNSATTLDVLSIHDTMNHTARPDGAICLEREPQDRLPDVVALSNRGDDRGEVRVADGSGLRAEIDVPSMEPARLRSIGMGYRQAFDAWQPNDVGFNRPYLGGYETQVVGPHLRAIEPLAVVRTGEGPPRHIRLGAWQNEFAREFLLGPESTAALMTAGTDWVGPPDDRVDWLAECMKVAHDLVRQSGVGLDHRS
jgi:N-formylglutamate amidohydrolase